MARIVELARSAGSGAVWLGRQAVGMTIRSLAAAGQHTAAAVQRRMTPAKRSAVQPAAAKKPAAKKPAVKKPAVKKPAVKKPAVKKPAVKKPAAKKPAAAGKRLVVRRPPRTAAARQVAPAAAAVQSPLSAAVDAAGITFME